MKYIVLLGDGMADRPLETLDGRTPLEAAEKPHMDFLAQHGAVGTAQTIPAGMPTGSDTANLSVLGYDPRKYYTGRSPLEAASLGVALQDGDVTFRCNLVTLSGEGEYGGLTMEDYSAGEITTQEAQTLIEYLAGELCGDGMRLYPGISYRHCLVASGAPTGSHLTPPHDISGKPIRGHLPEGPWGERLRGMMERSYALLREHPVNQARVQAGKHPANSVWFWGEGTRPALDAFSDVYGVSGGVVCAVDLVKGIGICAGMRVADVPGATGGMTTNYAGKAQAAIQLLREGCDLVYIHVEAPDECGHHGDVAAKIAAIEAIDRDILGAVLEEFQGEPLRILLTPDHPTPIALRTHTGDAVPFVLYESGRDAGQPAPRYTETCARETGIFLPEGPMMMQKLISGDF